jgi:long-chain acyl-CoA synthetase
VLAAVPRLWLLLMEGVRAKLAKAPERRRRRLEGALELAETRARARRFGGPGPSWRELVRRPLRALLAPVVARGIARALGVDRLRRGIAISGGGTLPDHVDVFFAALGIEILNGYGLTETSPVLTLRLPWRNAAGTVGPPLPRTEIAVRDPEIGERLPPGRRGVIHARGPQVMRGYFEDARATDAVLAPEGWFDTGDLGELTQAGDLRITGRAKDTIVLLSGENVEPEPIENALVSSPLIEQAVVVGQDRKQLGALVVPRRRDEPGALAGRELLSALRREIDELVSPRRGFRSHERIVRFRVLERPLTLEDGFLSQTLKVKRGVVLERMAAEIDALYRDEASQA